MTGTDDEQVRAERARAVGLFRYSLVRQAADPELTTRARGRLVRELAAAEHTGPFGARVRVCHGPAWTAGSEPGGAAGSTR
jgi:putative transposase